MTPMTVNIWFTPHTHLVEKVKLTKLPMACLIASTTHQDKEWSILLSFIIVLVFGWVLGELGERKKQSRK
jgi:Na+/citrate or Na+/malate symporter